MPTSTLKRLLDRPNWALCTPSPVTNAANHCMVDGFGPGDAALYLSATSVVWQYSPDVDAWLQLPSPGLATFSTGACGVYHPMGPTGTAVAGSTATTLNTATTIAADLRPSADGRKHRVRITGGTGAGQERGISSHTVGANSIITVDSAWGVTPDNTSTYVLITGRYYLFGGGVTAAGTFKFWDVATATWSGNLVVTGVPTFTADGILVATPSVRGSNGTTLGTSTFANTTTGFATGTATAGGASTLTNSAKAWATNQWTNAQVRIYSGTGAGQVRTIASNTGTVLTTSAAWTTNPDATSNYVIEANDDFLYLMGNSVVTMYRYSIAGNSWSTLTPGAARSGGPAGGVWARHIPGCTGTDWAAENAIINGRRIYSGRSGGGSTIDYYDIAANTWVSSLTIGSWNSAPSVGTTAVYDGENTIYLMVIATRTDVFGFDVRHNTAKPVAHLLPANGASVASTKGLIARYEDGTGRPAIYLYWLLSSATQLYRCLLI